MASGAEESPGWRFEPVDPFGKYAEAFWAATPTLAQIHGFARARLVAPWALLGNVLAMVTASMPPDVVLPPLVGGFGSLNLFIAVVAPSGGGKGVATKAAAALLQPPDGSDCQLTRLAIGSGEGLPAAYVQRVPDPNHEGRGRAPLVLKQIRDRVLFDVPEISTMGALGSRSGATLFPELCKVWTGEALGFQNRDSATCLPVAADSYRAALVAGVQPLKASILLDAADGGTPQRFVWLPATDPTMPGDYGPPVEPLNWTPPRVPNSGSVLRRDEKGAEVAAKVISVPDSVKNLVLAHRVAIEQGKVDPLDTHAVFACEKVAAAIALLHNRSSVTELDWQ